MSKIAGALLGAMIIGNNSKVACNPRQSDAEQAVTDFLENHITKPEEMRITGFSRLDSTSKIKDSVIVAIRKATETNGRYKKGITYANTDNQISVCNNYVC